MAAPARRLPGDSAAVDGALLLVVLLWASTFALFKVAWRDVDAVAFTGLRFTLMLGFAVGLVVLGRGRLRVRREDLPLVVASGLTGYFLYQLGFILGLDRTSAVASAILVATHPIFSTVFAWVAARARPEAMAAVGVAVGFLGVAVFLRFWTAFGEAGAGDLLSLGAAAAFGAYGVVSRPLVRRYPAREVMASTLGVGGVLIVLVSVPAMVRQDWSAVSATSWWILAYATVFPVYVAYLLWNWAIRRRGIAGAVVYGFLVPIAAGALAVALLGERPTVEQVVGAALVVAGLVLARWRPRSRPATVPAEPEPVLEETG